MSAAVLESVKYHSVIHSAVKPVARLQQLDDIRSSQIPFSQWNSHMIDTWLEVCLS